MRYLPHTEADLKHMLNKIGVDSAEDLLACVPKALRKATVDVPEALPERDLLRRYARMTTTVKVDASFVGAGLYRHFVPTAVDSIISRGEFFTAYTPYQPEVSQGTLQAVFEFQTMVCQLTGQEVANASMYDGASAAAEAVLMALRLSPKRKRVLLAAGLHPDYDAVCRTYLDSVGVELEVVPVRDGRTDLDALSKTLDDQVACVVVQSPNCLGLVEDWQKVAEACAAVGAKSIGVINDVVSLGLLKSPGAAGIDIVVGEGIGVGIAPNFGGPGVGLFATRKEFMRQMPGRVAGQAKDQDGRQGYVLTLAAREQHISRERARSNICTNQGLCALAFAVHASLLGPQGFKQLATQCAQRARYLRDKLTAAGVALRYNGPFFSEFVVELGDSAAVQRAIDIGVKRHVAVGVDLGRWRESWAGGLLVCVNELHRREDMDTLVEILAEAK